MEYGDDAGKNVLREKCRPAGRKLTFCHPPAVRDFRIRREVLILVFRNDSQGAGG